MGWGAQKVLAKEGCLTVFACLRVSVGIAPSDALGHWSLRHNPLTAFLQQAQED